MQHLEKYHKKEYEEIEGRRAVQNADVASVKKMLGIICTNILTHYSIIEEKFPDIAHSMDVWHKSKKLKKSLNEVIIVVMRT